MVHVPEPLRYKLLPWRLQFELITQSSAKLPTQSPEPGHEQDSVTAVAKLKFRNLLLFTSTLVLLLTYPVMLTLMLCVVKQLKFSVEKVFSTSLQLSLLPHGTEPFWVNSVIVCVGIPPVESVVLLNTLKPFVSFITT